MSTAINVPLLLALGVSGSAALLASLRLWAAPRPADAEKPIDWPLAVFLSVVGLTIFAGWLSVILVSINLFSAWLIALAWLMAAALILWKKRSTRLRSFTAATRYELALGVLLLGSAIVYFRPHEYVLGGSDAGTYMNIAVTAAHTGHFIVQDEWSAFLRTAPDVTLRRQPAHYLTRYLQFVGYYLDDDDPSRVIPQFFPFHPLLLALGVSVGGVSGGLLVTPLWGVLSLAAVYFVTRQLFGAPLALLAAALLAVTPTHIYFARYPTTEPLTLLLVFSALLAFQRLWDDRTAGPLWGVFGGAALGAALLTRIDLPVVLILFVAALIVVRVNRQWSRGWTWFALMLTVFSVHLGLDVVLINWPYFWNTYGVLRTLADAPTLMIAGAAGGGGVLVLSVIAWRQRKRWASRAPGAASPLIRRGLAIAVIALSVYAYFLRPVLEPIRMVTSWPGNVQYPILDGQNWVRIGWYITPLGTLLATLGLAWLARRADLRRLGLFLAVGVLTTIQYVYNIFNTPYHIYTMRRYVPIVLPVLMIFSAVTLGALWRARRSWTRYVAGALAGLLIAGLIYQARFVLPMREFYSAADQLAALNARLLPDSIVIMSEPAESALADNFGVPLRFTFNHDVATIRTDDAAAREFLDRLLARAAAEARPVHLIAINPIAPAVRASLQLQPRDLFEIRLRALQSTFYDYPSVDQPAYYGWEIYDVIGPRTALSVTQPITIDLGTLDTAFIRAGFYGKETLPDGASARWVQADASIDLPVAATGPLSIAVRALTFWPATVPTSPVSVWLDGQSIGEFTPGEAWQTFSFSGTAHPVNGTSLLSFKAATFNPQQLHLSADNRDLGFMLDRISVQP
ncbi:MAG: glycosyltransferase family 39 protein [Thermoflexales bacterium]|nr:glycosyltransferase family 39 protein [Thermoflexales bacterium]